jgi:N-acetylglucosamine kinase-like BadF-type ATPase
MTSRAGEPGRVYVAVDGGNSKTEVLVGDTTGAVLGYARGPGSNPQTAGGLDSAMRRIDALILEALGPALDPVREATTGAPDRGPLGSGSQPVLAQLCLAGADLPVEIAALDEAVAAAGWAEKSIVENDTMALLRAGTDALDAVAVVCGAGINCVARAADGRTVRFPSLGRISGDWGGGRELGDAALWHAARAEDGRGPSTALAHAVAAHFGHETVAEVSAAVHLRQIPRRRLEELAPVLFRVAATGDAVAGAVVSRQADEVVALAAAALRRLGLLAAPVAVVLGGGVLRARHPQLMDAITGRLADLAPRAEITVVTDPPVVGAALLALDTLGAHPAAHHALRAMCSRDLGDLVLDSDT